MEARIREKGLIFNSEMVRAILDGRKTQTRRPIKWKQTRFTEIGEREDGSKWYRGAKMQSMLATSGTHARSAPSVTASGCVKLGALPVTPLVTMA